MRYSDQRTSERGYSLMEVTIVLLAGVTVLLVVFGMIEEATKASLFVESHNELAQLAQLPVNRVQEEILQSKTVFQADAVGNGYVTRMIPNIATVWRPIADYRLPVQDASTNSVVPDTGSGTARQTGNMLLIARQLPPLLIPYDHDDDGGTPDIPFVADRYRFQMYYLRRDTTKGFRAVMDDTTFQRYAYIHDLVEVTSGVYADYFQLNTAFTGGLTAAQRTEVINGLSGEGITRAWNAGQNAVGTAFFLINSDATFTLQAAHNIVIVSTTSMMNLKQPGISGRLDYTVAMNPPTGGPDFRVSEAVPVPRYAVPDTSLPEFPGGLEFKVVGAGNSLKVLMRLVLFSNYGGNKMDAGEGVVLAQAG